MAAPRPSPIRTALIFTGIGALLLLALNLANRLPFGLPEREARMHEELDRAAGREAVAIGASIANGIDLPAACIDGATFTGTNDAFESIAVAHHLLDQPRPPRMILLVALPTFDAYDNGADAAVWPEHRRALYRVLHSRGWRGLIGGDWRQAILGNLMPAMGDDAWREPIRASLAALGVVGPRAPGVPTSQQIADPRRLIPDADAMALTRRRQLERLAYYSPGIAARARAALLALHRRMKGQGGRLVLVAPPVPAQVSPILARALPDQLAAFVALKAALAADGAIVIDAMRDARFIGDHRLYWDYQHLNGAGATAFSRALGAELRRRGQVPPCRNTMAGEIGNEPE